MNGTRCLTRPGPSASAPVRSGLLQRACACGTHTVAGGRCEACARSDASPASLVIGASDDPLEREAERVAAAVAPASGLATGATPVVRRSASRATAPAAVAPSSVSAALASPALPLPRAVRRDMESRFGHDFSAVRIHADSAADVAARELGAHAFTTGSHVAFAAGRFAPGTHEGRALIAHELAHVVQQSGSAGRSVQCAPVRRGRDTESRAPGSGRADTPVEVLEAIVHIMAGSQVAGDYGPAGENLMHPRYHIDIARRVTEPAHVSLLWEWFYLTNGVVTDKRGVQSIAKGAIARERIPRAAAETERVIARLKGREGAAWVARYRDKVQEFTRRAVREEVDDMMEAALRKERERSPDLGAMTADEQVKSVAVQASSTLQRVGALLNRAFRGEQADRVNERTVERAQRHLRTYLSQTFKGDPNALPPALDARAPVSRMTLPDAVAWLKGGLDAANAVLTVTDPAARRKLFEARATYWGTVSRNVEINKVLWQFVSGAVAFSGAATYGVARVLGRAELAAQVLDVSAKWLGGVSGALFVVSTVHGVAVLLDPDATSNEKAAAAVEAASGTLGLASLGSRVAPRLRWFGRWGGPVAISLSVNFEIFSRLADLGARARVGLTRLDWVPCHKATRRAGEEAQPWIRRLAVANVLMAQETDPARLGELRTVAGIYRTELVDGHLKPFLRARLRPDRTQGDLDDCGPALSNRFKPLEWVLDGAVATDDVALTTAAAFVNTSYLALKEWDQIVASSIKR